MGIQRQFNRMQGTSSSKLEALNEANEHRYLHATKGFRPVSKVRMAAAMITAEIKAGQMPFSMSMIQQALKAARGK